MRCLVITLVFPVDRVVGMTSISTRTVAGIALVTNIQVITTSKCWSAATMIVHQLAGVCGDEFFPAVEREDAGASRSVADIVIVWNRVPFVGGEGCDGSAELSSDQRESVFHLPALFMEGCCPEVVLRPSVEQF